MRIELANEARGACGRGPSPSWADRGGLAASGLCLVHCALLPVLALALPALSANEEPWIHGGLLIVVGVFAAAAFMARSVPWSLRALAGLGLVLLAAALFAPEAAPWLDASIFEPAATMAGSLLLMIAHYQNRHRGRPCRDAA